MSPPEENKLLVRRILEGMLNGRDLALIDDLAVPEYVYHAAANPVRGPAAFKQLTGMFLTAFPDIRITIEDQVAEGEKVATRWTMRGTHQGPFMGIAPTGRPVAITGLLSRISGGKLVEAWDRFDTMHFMQQLGAIPAPVQPTG